MAYSATRGTEQSNEVRFSPLTPDQIQERKRDSKLRKRDAQHWKRATDKFIDNVIL